MLRVFKSWQMPLAVRVALWVLLWNLPTHPSAGQDISRNGSVITPYDLMTAEDEFYYHHIYKLTEDADVSNWPLVKSLMGLGGNFLDASELARLANQSIKIDEQRRATKIMDMVRSR